MSVRFTPAAAQIMCGAIRETRGMEVLAIGDVEDGVVVDLTVVARGREHEVLALPERPRAGQVVIHNHPSGDLRPSDPDLGLAARFGDDGIGFVIVSSEVDRDYWVVEPHTPPVFRAIPEALADLFRGKSAPVPQDWEVRPAQVQMAVAVAQCLEAAHPLAVEAGTGTGKSLAYLVPAAQWALATDGKVVVSTFTKALQSQLMHSDIPVLKGLGLPIRAAIMQGRGNYLCKRLLAVAREGDPEPGLDDLRAWEERSETGALDDIPFKVDPSLWERVASDTDACLRLRCPHYAECHYFRARRAAAAAHVVIVNHALLLADLSLKQVPIPGILPKYSRIILDEAHHLEDAATMALARKLSARAIRVAVAPLRPRRRDLGALQLAADRYAKDLPSTVQTLLGERIDAAITAIDALHAEAEFHLIQVEAVFFGEARFPLRITPEVLSSADWQSALVFLQLLDNLLQNSVKSLSLVMELLEPLAIPEASAQPRVDVKRSMNRLLAQGGTLQTWLGGGRGQCAWAEPADRHGRSATLHVAPVDLAPVLKNLLWKPIPGTAATSATLTAGGHFGYWRGRVGLEEATELSIASPFDHAKQAILGLPRDIPPPDAPDFMTESAKVITEAIREAQGGTFVLCTSYQAVEAYTRALRRALPPQWPVLAQGEQARHALLEQFKAHRNAILVGTDSFWEGVSVKGEGLRLVIIPRIPFRVPTDPLQVARQEALVAQGKDPFNAHSLPQAILKLKQGYGRLIRAQSDHGVVLFLDTRLHSKTYGRIILTSIPPARRVVGPWRAVREALQAFFSAS